MAKDFWEVMAVRAIQSADQSYEFMVTLSGPGGTAHVPVPIDALVNYSEFQKLVLSRLGMLYRHACCEGRPTEAANEQWRILVHVLLNQQSQQASSLALN